MQRQPRLFAIGNAPIDLIAEVDEAVLAEFDLQRGACVLITHDVADALERRLEITATEPGGGAANMSCFLAALGESVAFAGKVANDKAGRIFSESLAQRGVMLTTAALDASDAANATARIFVLVTPDRDRSFAAHYGATDTLSPDDLDKAVIAQAEITYMDCFTLATPRGGEVLRRAAQIARENGRMVAVNTNDLNFVRNYRDDINDLLGRADIFFSNLQEALVLTGQANVQDAVNVLRKAMKYGAVTLGAEGALVFAPEGAAQHVAPPALSSPVVNTNGAGDAFAAGFCYGILNGLDAAACGRLGCMAAAEILVIASPRPQGDMKHLLKAIS